MTTTEQIRGAVHQLGIEIRIMAALTAYAEDAGADVEIESHQAYRIGECYQELRELVGDPIRE